MKVYPERIAASLGAAFPELGQLESLTILSDGMRSLVVATPTGEVFKIARSWDAGASYVKEIRLLPLVRPLLPVTIPHPVWHAGASRNFPFGVVGYPMLSGTPLQATGIKPESTAGLARQAGALLAALHRVPLDAEIRGCVPEPRAVWCELERLRDTLVSPLRELFSAPEYRTIEAWWSSMLSDATMHYFEPVLHHGDFWHGNLLVDDPGEHLVGLVDFEDAAAGDPAQDIATLLHAGRPFTLEALAEYQRCGGILDDALLYRAQRLWELREFTGIGIAIKTTNQAEFDAAVEKLRNGPLLNDTTRRETQLWPPPQR